MRISNSHKHKLEKKYFIGDSLAHKWSSVYNYKPVSEEKFTEKGEVFAVISLLAVSGFNSMTAGNLLVDCFHEAYFESKKEQITAALSEAITAVQDRLADLLAKEVAAAKAGVDFNIAAMVVRGEEVYFASLGGNKIYLLPFKAASKLLDITASLRDPFGKGIIKIGSSFLRKDQRFLLISERGGADINAEEKIYALRSLNDLRFKNREYANPEEIALFLVGVDVVVEPEEITPKSIKETMAGRPQLAELEAGEQLEADGQPGADEQLEADEQSEAGEQPETDEQSGVAKHGALQPEDFIGPDTDSAGAGQLANEFKEESDDPDRELMLKDGALAGSDRLINQDNLASEKLDENFGPEAELTEPSLMTAKADLSWKGLFEHGKAGLNNATITLRKRLEQMKRQRETRKLQQLRAGAAQQSELSGAYQVPHLPGSHHSQDLSEHSTVKAIFIKIGHKLREFKDIVLYDLLQVNQSGRYTIRRDSLSFKVLILVGIIIAIVLAYSSIRAIGKANEEAKQREQAYLKLDEIRREVDKVENNAVLNSLSFGDIQQREALISNINQIQGRFTSELAILPQTEVDKEKQRLTAAEAKARKIKTPSLNVLADIGNLFEGSVNDMVQIERNLYILDGVKGRIYEQPALGGDAQILIEGLNQPTSLAVDSNNELVVYEAGAEQVISIINPATKKKRSIAGISTSKMPRAKDLAIYKNTNGLYAISSGIPEVQLSTRVGENYALPTNRYSSANLTDMRDIEIVDGRLIILAAGVGLDRVGIDTRNETVEAFSDVKDSILQANAMGADNEWLYLADNNNKRLLVLTKSRGNLFTSDFVSQVKLDNVDAQIVEIVVDRSKDLIFLATPVRIYALKWSEIK